MKSGAVGVKYWPKTLRHARIATMPNWHKGIFEREGTVHKGTRKKAAHKPSGLSVQNNTGL